MNKKDFEFKIDRVKSLRKEAISLQDSFEKELIPIIIRQFNNPVPEYEDTYVGIQEKDIRQLHINLQNGDFRVTVFFYDNDIVFWETTETWVPYEWIYDDTAFDEHLKRELKRCEEREKRTIERKRKEEEKEYERLKKKLNK